MKPSEYDLEEPIAAIATALAPAALAIVRVSGSGSLARLGTRFSRPQALSAAPGNSLVHGWILDGEGKRVDEVMVACYRSPKSFTGEESAEIVCHGGVAVALACYRAVLDAGFRPAERGEFTLRAFAHGKADLTRSEAVREIIDSRTDAAREAAVGRLAGSLAGELASIRALVIGALAAIGVEIEYPEDEETVKGSFDAKPISEAASRLASLESAWAAERLVREGATVVLAGKTNAGKSSLFNAILKSDRAIVSSAHGTTRDWLEAEVDFNGIPVRLFDTAGIRETDDTVEAEGVSRSRALARGADAVLYLVDATTGVDREDEAFISSVREETKVIVVWNKADRTNGDRADGALAVPSGAIRTSAKTGSGIADLVNAVAQALAGDDAPRADGPAPGSERQRAAIALARESLEHALAAERAGFPLDAVTQDLEDALSAIGEITGETTGSDVLDAVFSSFCVGK